MRCPLLFYLIVGHEPDRQVFLVRQQVHACLVNSAGVAVHFIERLRVLLVALFHLAEEVAQVQRLLRQLLLEHCGEVCSCGGLLLVADVELMLFVYFFQKGDVGDWASVPVIIEVQSCCLVGFEDLLRCSWQDLAEMLHPTRNVLSDFVTSENVVFGDAASDIFVKILLLLERSLVDFDDPGWAVDVAALFPHLDDLLIVLVAILEFSHQVFHWRCALIVGQWVFTKHLRVVLLLF